MRLRPHALAAAVLAGTVTAWAAGLGLAAGLAAPDSGGGLRLVVFAPWHPDERAFAAMLAAGARPVRRAPWPGGWVAAIAPGTAATLYDHGAALVLAAVPFHPALAGCAGA